MKAELTIRRMALSKMNPAPYNPRVRLRPGDPEYQQLRNSLEAFGYIDPLIYNQRTGNLVGGHQRYNVLKAEGVKCADVSVVDLDEAQEKLANLALNKVKGRWDQEGLAQLLEELAADDAIDIALAGFNNNEVDAIIKEGENLMEVLAKPDADEEEDEEEDAGGGGKRIYALIVDCKSKAQRRNVMKKLAQQGMAVRFKS